MSASIDDLLRYVGFTPNDGAALRALHEAAPDLRRIVGLFYQSIEADPEAKAVLADDAQVQRLKLSLVDWLERVLVGPWDAEYAQARARIGRVHVRVGLPQRFMLTAMSVIRRELHLAANELLGGGEATLACHSALARILDVDLAIMLETYREDSFSALRRLEEIERKLLADELTLSEERHRAVLESAEVIAIIVGTDDDVYLFNHQAEKVTGRARTEILDREALDEVWHPNDLADVVSAVEATRSGHVSQVIEARIVDRASESHVVRWHVTSLPPKTSGDVCLIGVDLTAERRLAARTRRAEQLASLGTLAAGLAHEIRNPLNAAELQLTVAERRLNREIGESAANEPISVVRTELRRLATLVEDFLAYARPMPLRTRAVDLRAGCRSVVEFLAPVAQEHGVSITLEEGPIVTASCDEEQCRQVLLNLTRNAIEAAREGGKTVLLKVERSGPSALISIVDSGPGLPEGVDIFEPFATTKEGGTGLGLSIVKRIIEQHNGTIAALRDGEFTVFEIEVPIAQPSEPI